MNNHQTEGLKGRKQRRDFYCVVADAFYFFARRAAIVLGSAWAFVGALFVILVWLITGPTFHFSDTWQLIINTATTIITFLMVFLIQNTQNRDAKAVHLKLDELIRALKGAPGNLKINSNGCAKKPNMTEPTTTRQRGSPPEPLPTGLFRFFARRPFAKRLCRSDTT